MRKRDVKTIYWIVFIFIVLIAFGGIPLRETISTTVFFIIAFVMLILNKRIIDIIWNGVK